MWLAVAEATRGSSFEPQSPAVVSKTWSQKIISTLQMFIDNYFDLTRFQYPNTGLVMLNMTTMMVTMMMMILPSFLPSKDISTTLMSGGNAEQWRIQIFEI